MDKIICAPGSYLQGRGPLGRLSPLTKKLSHGITYLLVDSFIDNAYHAEIEKSFDNESAVYSLHRFGGECSDKEIEKHCKQIKESGLIIGIGGGKTLDTAKAVAHFSELPVAIVPTIASTDAPCSRLSVIYHEDGSFDRYLPLPANPNMVIMDTDVIVKAPWRFMAAGIGDALATYYEAMASIRKSAFTMAGAHATNAAHMLAKLCRDMLFKNGCKAKAAMSHNVCTAAVENIIEANTFLSGIGFESGGLAAAHAIHNGLTVLSPTHALLHGEKVAFGTIVQCILENRSNEELSSIIRFCNQMGLPTSLDALNLSSATDEELMQVAIASCDENDTMGNMPFPVTPEDVFSAIKAADALSNVY